MKFTLSKQGPQPTPDDFRSFQQASGFLLPDGYVDFLQRSNGGRPAPSLFPITGFDNNPEGRVHFFFGINYPIECYDLLWNVDTFVDRIPNGLLPIACDGSGDIVCLAVAGEDEGMVFFWDYYGEAGPESRENLYLVAFTFEEFCNSFRDTAEP